MKEYTCQHCIIILINLQGVELYTFHRIFGKEKKHCTLTSKLFTLFLTFFSQARTYFLEVIYCFDSLLQCFVISLKIGMINQVETDSLRSWSTNINWCRIVTNKNLCRFFSKKEFVQISQLITIEADWSTNKISADWSTNMNWCWLVNSNKLQISQLIKIGPDCSNKKNWCILVIHQLRKIGLFLLTQEKIWRFENIINLIGPSLLRRILFRFR